MSSTPGCTLVAYLIAAHSDPQQFGRLLKRLSHPGAAFFVHVDAKSNIADFERETACIANVTYCQDRVRVMWAGFSQVEATLRLIELAHRSTEQACTHFVLLSGADYPIARNEEILQAFGTNPGKEFIRGFSLMESDEVQAWKVKGWHFREHADRNSLFRRPFFVIERLLRVFPRRVPPDLRFVCGSNWWALTRNCAKFCYDFARTRSDFVHRFRNTFASDEIFFHTIVHGSPFASQAPAVEPYRDITSAGGPWFYANLHYLNGRTLTSIEDAQLALSQAPRKLFARKFDSGESRAALECIEAALDGRAPPRP